MYKSQRTCACARVCLRVPYSLVWSPLMCVYIARCRENNLPPRINSLFFPNFLPFSETLKQRLSVKSLISFPVIKRQKKKDGRVFPGRPLRRPHLRLGHRKWRFPRRRALVFVLSDEVRVVVRARERFFILEQNLTRFSAHFFFFSHFQSARSLFFFLLSLSLSLFRRNSLADLFSLPLSFPFLSKTSQNVPREENRPLPSFPPETFVQKDT